MARYVIALFAIATLTVLFGLYAVGFVRRLSGRTRRRDETMRLSSSPSAQNVSGTTPNR